MDSESRAVVTTSPRSPFYGHVRSSDLLKKKLLRTMGRLSMPRHKALGTINRMLRKKPNPPSDLAKSSLGCATNQRKKRPERDNRALNSAATHHAQRRPANSLVQTNKLQMPAEPKARASVAAE
jgi:hypothetical protein